MKYWIEGISDPLTRTEIHGQRHRFSPSTRCAPVGVNEWKPITQVIPDLFDTQAVPPIEPVDTPSAAETVPAFNRHSGWTIFFRIAAGLNIIIGIVILYYGKPLVGFLAGMFGCLVCLFFAAVCHFLAHIRWLISQPKG